MRPPPRPPPPPLPLYKGLDPSLKPVPRAWNKLAYLPLGMLLVVELFGHILGTLWLPEFSYNFTKHKQVEKGRAHCTKNRTKKNCTRMTQKKLDRHSDKKSNKKNRTQNIGQKAGQKNRATKTDQKIGQKVAQLNRIKKMGQINRTIKVFRYGF